MIKTGQIYLVFIISGLALTLLYAMYAGNKQKYPQKTLQDTEEKIIDNGDNKKGNDSSDNLKEDKKEKKNNKPIDIKTEIPVNSIQSKLNIDSLTLTKARTQSYPTKFCNDLDALSDEDVVIFAKEILAKEEHYGNIAEYLALPCYARQIGKHAKTLVNSIPVEHLEKFIDAIMKSKESYDLKITVCFYVLYFLRKNEEFGFIRFYRTFLERMV